MKKLLLCLVVSLFLLSNLLHAQNAGTGAYAFASFDQPGFDSINLGNLNTRFTIPIVSRSGRGLPFNYSLQYEGLIWTVANGTWVPDSSWGFTGELNGSGFTGYLSHVEERSQCPAPWGNKGAYDTTLVNFIYHDPFGGSHAFDYKEDEHSCPDDLSGEPVITGNGASNDGSGYTLIDPTAVKNRNGTIIVPSYSPAGSSPTSLTDRNGNQISSTGYGNFTDTLGATALTMSGSSPLTFTYPVTRQSNGATTATTTLSYRTYTVRTNFGCSGVVEYGSTSVSLPDRVTFADGSYYAFSYEPTYQATDGAVTGRLASVTLPTGGTIHYSYTDGCSGAGINGDGTVGSLTRSTSDGTRIYHRDPVNGNSTSTTVTDEKGNQSSIIFTIDAGTQNYYETHRRVYQGSAGGTPLLDRYTCYNGTAAPCDSTALALPVSEADTISSYNGGSQVTTKNFYDTKGSLLTESDVYGGSTVLTKTQTTYNSLGEVTAVTQLDGNNTPYTYSYYNYDEGSPIATSGLPRHTAVSGTRGNLTSSHISAGATYLSTSTTYYDTGMPATSTAADGGQTGYIYDNSGAFVQETALPLDGLTTSAQYDAYSAALLNSTGFNTGETTTITQYDPLMRAKSATLPDSSTVIVSYDSPTQITSTRAIDSSSTATTKTILDGYGRLQRTAIQASSSLWYLTDYCYDAAGHLQYQSTPYSSSSYSGSLQCSPSTGDSYSYDALGRVVLLTHADGSSVSHTYNSRAVQMSTSTGVSRITQYDMLGRISAVCEISSNANMPTSGSPVSCGMDIAGTGFVTQYSYDLANHKMTINQGGQQRIFSTDAAGRSTYSLEPERGATNYAYAYNSTGLATVRTRPQANQTGSATTTTTTQYDLLGRVVSVTYSDGTPSKHFSYGESSSWSGLSLGSSRGRLTSAYTSTPTIPVLAGTQFGYDTMGRVALMESCLPDWCGNSSWDDRRWYIHNGLNQVSTETYDTHNGNVTLNYQYNLAGQLLQVSGGQDDATAFVPMWNVVQNTVFGPAAVQLGNGLTDVKLYTTVGRVYATTTCGNGSQSLTCDGNFQPYWTYANFNSGHIDRMYDSTNPILCHDLSYDEFGRLTKDNDCSGNPVADYTYDRWGNRTSQQSFTTGASPSFIYNTGSNGISGLPYDAAGNLMSEGWNQFQYDAEGNLTSVNAGSSTSASYIYDAFNRRVITNVAGNIERYGYDINGRRAITWNGGGPFLKAVQYYAGNSPIAYWTASDNHIHFQHQDWLGTEKIRTSYTGATEATFWTMTYGELAGSTGTDTNRDHYAGMEYDPESGTSHAMYRQYINGQGRWMSPDPYDGSYRWKNPQSFNRYAYVLNNPLSRIDPGGMDSEPYCNDGTDYCSPDNYDPGSYSGYDGYSPCDTCTVNGSGGVTDPNGGSVDVSSANGDDSGTGTETAIYLDGAVTSQGNAPSNPTQLTACQAKTLNAINAQFGTNLTADNVLPTSDPNPQANGGQVNTNFGVSSGLSASQFNAISSGRYAPGGFWGFITGYGSSLHVVGGPSTLDPTAMTFANANVGGVYSAQFTVHIDSAWANNPFGAIIHWFIDVRGHGSHRQPC